MNSGEGTHTTMEVERASSAGGNDRKIDESLYSRQLYALGREAQGRLAASSVLVVNARGLGAEIAKNIILMGVRQVSLHDPEPVEMADLVSQFYLNGTDIGKPRAAACVEKFAELNPHVDVNVVTGAIDAALVSRYQVVVLTGSTLATAVSLDRMCVQHGARFLWADTKGVFAFAFNDFGPEFTVHDATGEQPLTYLVAAVTQEQSAVVSIIEDQRFELEPGARVTFSSVEGMPELNFDKITNPEPYIVKTAGRNTFQINADTSKLKPYVGGGYVTEVKAAKTMAFAPLEKSVAEPGAIEPTDFAKDGRQYQLLLAFRALWRWMEEHAGALPRLRNDEDAEAVVRIARELNSAAPEDRRLQVDEALVRQLSHLACGGMSPTDTFLGGVVSQEVIKACTGKYTPVRQWLLWDAVEVLPDVPAGTPASEFAPIGSRYDRQIALLGRGLQERVENARYFLVGAGAIGCEVLKVWAMMGLGSGSAGQVHVTDMDVIERSNLSRQFLFRERDVEKLKSETAANAVRRMNPNLHITHYALRVGGESESVYNEQFYASLDGVCTALDNFDARRYVDMQCVANGKPMLDSGTLGPKGNTQVVVPHLTENYGASNDPPEKSIPLCTLHHFPHQIEHCIQWARDKWAGLFADDIEAIAEYLEQPGFLESLEARGSGERVKVLGHMYANLVTDRTVTWADCLRWARVLFEQCFANDIAQLLFQFPADSKTSEGLSFWSPPKRCPHPLVYDPTDESHVSFVVAAAQLRAYNFGIEPGGCAPADLEAALQGLAVPTFKPASASARPSTDAAAAAGEGAKAEEAPALAPDDAEAERYLSALPKPAELRALHPAPAVFEKDDDGNYHMAFVTACSNLRASNYKIPHADFQRTKQIAGKIIPAMISTTAVVSGLQCIELLKALQRKPLAAYKNGYVNLALPLFAFSEPIAAPRRKVREGWEWTLWDQIEIRGDITLAEFLAQLRDKYKIEPSMVSCGSAMIHSGFIGGEKLRTRLETKLSRIVEDVTKAPIPPDRRSLIFEMCCTRLEDDTDVDVPPIKYILTSC
eukprot:m51a1_g8883 putative ubiquitin activating enzyme e1 (1049) ;mRNA; f:649634-653725